MSSILDIDLDYFNLVRDPLQRLRHLLEWGECPVAFVVERHHHVFRRWKDEVRRGAMTPPTNLLYVGEHHDMMDGARSLNIGNVVRNVMEAWPECQV